jgi:hypothetical protein
MFELVPGVINVFAVYIVVKVLCDFTDVGFDFLSVSFGEDISLGPTCFLLLYVCHVFG